MLIFVVALQHPLAPETINYQDINSRPNSTAKAIVVSEVCAPDFDNESAERETFKFPKRVLLGKHHAAELTTKQV